MTTTTVDTQALAAGSGGTSTPVKLTLQGNTTRLVAELKVVSTRATTPGVTHEPFRPEFTMFWAFSADDITLNAAAILALRHCAKCEGMVLNPDLLTQRQQITDKPRGQYAYFWFEYPRSPDAYSVTIKTTELFQASSLSPVSAPATATSPGTHPSFATDAFYAYFTIADDTWRRVAIGDW